MKTSVMSSIIATMVLIFVSSSFAQAPKAAPPAPGISAAAAIPKPKTKAQIKKFEDEIYRLSLAQIQKFKKERIKHVNTVTEERIKTAKMKHQLQLNFPRGSDDTQKLVAQLQEVDSAAQQKEKVLNDMLQDLLRKDAEEFQKEVRRRRDEFYRQ